MGVIKAGWARGCAVLEEALLLVAPMGIYYNTPGRLMTWILFAFALVSLGRLAIDRRLVAITLLFVGALLVGALLSANPSQSIDGVSRIAYGFCMFLPGVLLGVRLKTEALGLISLVPALVLALMHFWSPVRYGDLLVYGFESNPNSIGHGLLFALLLLFVVLLFRVRRRLWWDGRSFWSFLSLLLVIVIFGVLLVISNYRAGWIGVAIFAVLSLLGAPVVSPGLRLLGVASSVMVLLALLGVRDVKGFGYGSVGERLDLWSRSLGAWWSQFFWFGSGYRSFFEMSHLYYYGSVTKAYRFPHNILIEIAFSSGVFGIAAWVLWVAALCVLLNRAMASAGPCWFSCSPLFGIVVFLCVGQVGMQLASFPYIASISIFLGIFWAQLSPPGSFCVLRPFPAKALKNHC